MQEPSRGEHGADRPGKSYKAVSAHDLIPRSGPLSKDEIQFSNDIDMTTLETRRALPATQHLHAHNTLYLAQKRGYGHRGR